MSSAKASAEKAARLARRLFLLVSLALVAACAASPPPPPCPTDAPAKTDFKNDVMLAGSAATSDIIPVDADDPQRGSPTALVTIVEFGDLQCPFCAKAAVTMERVLETYGNDNVRFVWKQYPLPFHKAAGPAAELSAALMKRGGSDAFFAFYRRAFTGEGMPSQEGLESMIRDTAQNPELASLGAEYGVKKVEADTALAKRLGVRGTPAFFINGIFLSGAQPYEKFAEIIDQELAAAKAGLAAGTPRDRIYPTRVSANRDKLPQADDDDDKPRPSRPADDDKTVWAVPIDGSPFQGPADAPVTMVMFTDFQCPFCARANGTVAELQRKYGSKLRIVHKNNPLTFHKEAEPAAELAAEVLAKKGNAAFWTVSASLFAAQKDLGTDTYASIAAQMGLPKDPTLAAIKAQKHKARIEKDQALAQDLDANGTPHFFINGRRLAGAQPVEQFSAVIDAELAKAEMLVKGGTPAAKLYDQIVAIGKKPGLELEKLDVPPPGKDNPSRGPANAPIVIQVWSDFQCPFCSRLAPTLDELQKAFPGKIRVVFRHLPLAMHPNAALAAEAGVEAFKEGGSTAFWKMHDAMFADQTKLDRQGLEATAKQIGLDPKRFGKALDDHVNKPAVEADQKIASDKGISGTPTSSINGYEMGGAQPLAKWKRAVQKILDEQKAPPGAQPAKR